MPARRDLLKTFVGALGVSALTACGHKVVACKVPLPPPPIPELTIDTHCHIFNGSDLQVKSFIDHAVLPEKGLVEDIVIFFSDMLQTLVWSPDTGAPSGPNEIAVLDKLIGADDATVKAQAQAHRESSYTRARNALRGTPVFQSFSQRMKGKMPPAFGDPRQKLTQDSVLSELHQRLPETYEEHIRIRSDRNGLFRGKVSGTADANRTLAGVLDYVIEGFQYRYVTVRDYQEKFTPANRSVDLMLASMVDYDWWLASGSPTPTTLQEQLAVMEKITLLTRGRVHAMAPYDPLREVAFQLGQASWSSLAFVRDAVAKHGAVGVKLYPPMGFAALGNATLPVGFWDAARIPEALKSQHVPDLGARLDAALREFYDWCIQEEVPVMAHAARSNGVAQQYASLAGPEHWAVALQPGNYPDLRISFGHFGDFSGNPAARAAPPDALSMAGLMQAPGSRAYADVGYSPEILFDCNHVYQRFSSFYQTALGRLPASRVMFGTDWDLLMNAGDVDSYIAQFTAMFGRLDNAIPSQPSLSRRFFGANALDWAGLHPGGKGRKRLDDFYAANGVSAPAWTQKASAAIT